MRRALAWLVGALVLVFAVATAALFVWPSVPTSPQHADAVVVLSGGRGDRLPKALALARRGVAPALVISHGHDPVWRAANRVCDEPQPFEVLCPDPHPDTTQGEALMLRALARDRHWRRLAVVTSRYHVTRARLVLGRCIAGRFTVVASSPHDSLLSWAAHVGHEWAGVAYAEVVHRTC